ncbi:MAG: hypothetical protein NTZ16_02330 [Verrucomicrobia bacterium]|nr:hypothetical protein [Verrucomicrobiota bacterium]
MAKEYRVTMPELIRIGDVVVDGLPLVVGALGNFPGEKGVLGADLMGECQALIDFRNHRMWLRPPEVKK